MPTLPFHNPLHDVLLDAQAEPSSAATRMEAVRRHAFAVPTAAALDAIRRVARHGVVELGAGTGYWAYVADQQGIDVLAVDIEPAPSPASKWFAHVRPWYPVVRGDHTVAAEHPDRALLLVWPPIDEAWPLDAVDRYRAAGGRHVVYVGEPPGGGTGDDALHARLGLLDGCNHCTYGVESAPCVCDIDARWHEVASVELPHWPGFADDLHVFEAARVSRRRARGRRGGWWRRAR